MVAESKETHGGNLNGIRCETNRYFRNKKREYLKEKSIGLKQTVRTKILETYIEF
jgi:hypothetical protein